MSLFCLGIATDIFPPKHNGQWWLTSKKDPRFNCYGHGKVGWLFVSPECRKKLKELQKEFGALPDDLEYGHKKD